MKTIGSFKYKDLDIKKIVINKAGVFINTDGDTIPLDTLFSLMQAADIRINNFYAINKIRLFNGVTNKLDKTSHSFENFLNLTEENNREVILNEEEVQNIYENLVLISNIDKERTQDISGINYKVSRDETGELVFKEAYSIEESDKIFMQTTLLGIFGIHYLKRGGIKNFITFLLYLVSGGLFGMFFVETLGTYFGRLKVNDIYVLPEKSTKNKILLGISAAILVCEWILIKLFVLKSTSLL